MVELIAKAVLEGAERRIGSVTISPAAEAAVTSIAPFQGQQGKVAQAIFDHCGLGWPDPNRQTRKDDARALWVGPGRVLLIGPAAPDLGGLAAVTDQTGAEAVLWLDGPHAEAVLARLVPIDLRAGIFPVGTTARTMIGHMTGSVTRVAEEALELRVMRSMAGTLMHDVSRAAELLAARGV